MQVFSSEYLVNSRSCGHLNQPPLVSATNENANGGLQSFIINSDGSLVTQDTISSDGDSPAFAVALSTGQVAVMNYGSGNGRVIPTSDSLVFDRNATVETFPLKNSTAISHPHMVLEHGSEIFVPDLVGHFFVFV
jgi:hypothetical protein